MKDVIKLFKSIIEIGKACDDNYLRHYLDEFESRDTLILEADSFTESEFARIKAFLKNEIKDKSGGANGLLRSEYRADRFLTEMKGISPIIKLIRNINNYETGFETRNLFYDSLDGMDSIGEKIMQIHENMEDIVRDIKELEKIRDEGF